MNGRTSIQCKLRWRRTLMPSLRKGAWTKEEDEILLSFVRQHGSANFLDASRLLEGRNSKQCYERYINVLNPRVKKGDWTDDEDYMIFRLYSQHGGKWIKFTRFFDHKRSENALKNRFYSYIRKIKRSHTGNKLSEGNIIDLLYCKEKEKFKLNHSLVSDDDIAEYEYRNFGYNGRLDNSSEEESHKQTFSTVNSTTNEFSLALEEQPKQREIFHIVKCLPADKDVQKVDLLFDLLLMQDPNRHSINRFSNPVNSNDQVNYFSSMFECFDSYDN